MSHLCCEETVNERVASNWFSFLRFVFKMDFDTAFVKIKKQKQKRSVCGGVDLELKGKFCQK